MINYHKLLNMAIFSGYTLLESGAEIYRVEESIQRLLSAYGVERQAVFVIPNLIIVTIETTKFTSLTKTRRVYARGTNFDRIAEMNDLIRFACRETPNLDELLAEVRRIRRRPSYPPALMFTACGFGSGFFTLFFGGSFIDCIVSFSVVFLARILCAQMERYHANSFYVTTMASFLHTGLSLLLASQFPVLSADKIIIGTLMTLVPGVSFTTAIRDVIARDILAGMLAGMEALLVATAIAIGNTGAYYAIAALWRWMGV